MQKMICILIHYRMSMGPKQIIDRNLFQSLLLFLMNGVELQYQLQEEALFLGYSNNAFCQQRGIWWLGKNKFTRILASVV